MGASLAPQWELKTVELQQVSASWLCRIHEALKKLPKGKCSSGNVELFQCSILLPLNSPLRDEVAGDVMPSKRLAKRSAAQRVCQLLHEMKEFDDVHLLPKVRETTVLDDDMKTIASTQPKMEKHPRQYPECFQNCRPAPGRTSYVYSIDFKLTEPNEAMFFVPEAVNTQFGILSSKPIPPLCRFPLITKAGKVEVDVKKSKTFVLNEEQCLLLESFHKWLFQDVIHLLKEQLTFDLDKSIVQCLLVPLKVETTTIDYEFADKMLNAPKIDWNARPNGDHYDFNPSRFEDAVVVPWYESTKKLKPYYVDSLTSLTPLSSFSALITGTYYSYFKGRNLNITNLEQRLVKVSAETWDKNFLSPR